MTMTIMIRMRENRAGPGVSPASPWARATPLIGATTRQKKKNSCIVVFESAAHLLRKSSKATPPTHDSWRVTFVWKHLSPQTWVAGVLTNSNQKSKVKEFSIKIISLIGIRQKCLLPCILVLVNILYKW